MRRPQLFLLEIVVYVIASGCGQASIDAGGFFFSFEDGMEGWIASGIDVGEDGGVVDDWSIIPSQELSKDGTTSLKYVLVNSNDAGKIFIKREFSVEPLQVVHVNVRYAIWGDCGDIGFGRIITGVLLTPPQSRDDLLPTFQEITTDGRDCPPVWLNKSYDFMVQSGMDGVLCVVIGIWGQIEVAGIFYIDAVRITID